jgi:hypothetical protein
VLVELLSHKYDDAPLTERLLVAPEQIVLIDALTVNDGIGFTVLVMLFVVIEHPALLVTITSIVCPFDNEVVVKVGEEVFCVLVPFILKLYITPPFVVKVTEVPIQIVLSTSLLVNTEVGNAFTVKIAAFVVSGVQ